MPDSYLAHSGHILALARRSYDRLTPGQESESQIPIILSAVAFECFLNDLQVVAKAAAVTADASVLGATLGRVLTEAGAAKTAFLLRVDLVHLVLTGVMPNKGEQPYQDIRLLVSLRNALVHAGPEGLGWSETGELEDYPKLVQQFVQRRVIPAPSNPAIATNQYVVVPSVAAWAHNTVVRAWKWFAELAPNGSLKMLLTVFTAGLTEIAPDQAQSNI